MSAASDEVETMVDELGKLVRCESPSADLDAVARSAKAVADLGERLTGATPEFIVLSGRTHLRWRFGNPGRVLLIGHHDTVWPIGSLREHPFRVADGKAYGPGCFDMKAGLVQMFHALAACPSLDGVTVLVTGDEEVGSPSARPLIEDEARKAAAALVLEGSADGGALKTARRGAAFYEIRIEGRAAHAGLEPWTGANATVEAAHQVLALAALDRGPHGVTVTPTLMSAGTAANTVAAAASLMVDVRAGTIEEQRATDAAIRALTPRTPGTNVQVDRRANHTPLEESASKDLFVLAERVAADLGLAPLAAAHVGGASDGNIAAGAGTPTLDGLGAVGGNAHAAGEHVMVDAMPERAQLLRGLVDALVSGSYDRTNQVRGSGAIRS